MPRLEAALVIRESEGSPWWKLKPSDLYQLFEPPPVPQLSTIKLDEMPCLAMTLLNTASAVGLRQMLPRQTKRTEVLGEEEV